MGPLHFTLAVYRLGSSIPRKEGNFQGVELFSHQILSLNSCIFFVFQRKVIEKMVVVYVIVCFIGPRVCHNARAFFSCRISPRGEGHRAAGFSTIRPNTSRNTNNRSRFQKASYSLDAYNFNLQSAL